MKKNFRCCWSNCKFKHDALIVILDHLYKKHKLEINGKPFYVNSCTAETHLKKIQNTKTKRGAKSNK